MAQDAPSLDDHARRFLFRRRIGEGAFGVVWEAYDTDRGVRVALKALTRTEPSSLYLFKREFRALADIVHPNLVTLYELLSFGEKWFFTMELVEGTDFVDHVRGAPRHKIRSPGTETVTILRSGPVTPGDLPAELTPDALGTGVDMEVLPHAWYDQPTMESTTLGGDEPRSIPVLVSPSEPRGAWSDQRARAALAQLAEGLAALHDAGKLHRDIKPSNILVTGEGRVVILDFGLITELWPTGIHRDTHAIVGTPAFMSPEQSLGRSLTPASDWYAVGVMLYMALTGKLPFEGAPLQVLVAKQRHDPPPPSAHAKDVPADLEEMCMDLLRRKPEERPTGAEVLQRLGAVESSGRRSTLQPRSVFVGRDEQLAALMAGYAATQNGRPSAVILHGASGMGKSALTQAFVRALRRDEPDALVLAGRCFPRESVPYKAVDSIIDELSVYLQQLNTSRLAVLMPGGTDALLRIFPVLRQVESAAPQTQRPHVIGSEIELRRRAFAELRELLGRIAERKHTVLILDDLQWSDADSDALLAELLRGPGAPPVFVLATFRTDDVESTPLLRTLRAEGVETRVLQIGPLGFEEARALALEHLGANEARAAAIARESGGNPFFVEVLADHVGMLAGADDRSPESVARVDLGDVFRDKIARLPKVARVLLETVAVAGHPIAIIPAWRASSVSLPEQSMLALLLVRHLLRARTDVGSAREELEPYHERIREAVLSGMSAEEIRERHEQIAVALEAAGDTDPEVLASHLEAAGRRVEAGQYALDAARQSAAALAFDRAARLYRWALSLAPTADDSETRERLGDALANAGRGAEAADAYLAAARGALPSRVLGLRQKASEQLLISGHIEQGMEVVRLVMTSLGMWFPQSREAALASFVVNRARLKLRGIDFKERSANDIPPDVLLRIDACWSVAAGLSQVDSIRGTDFQLRHLLLALDAGEPYRIARALSLEVTFAASSGPKSLARTAELAKLSLELAERIRHPHALGLATSMAGAARYLAGRWREGVEMIERGARILREQCTGVTWEMDTVLIFLMSTLMQLGEWKELTARYDDFLRSARARGDLYAETHAMVQFGWYVELARDAPWTARENHERAYRRKPTEDPGIHDFFYALGSVGIDLYCDNPEGALRTLDDHWSRFRAGFLFQIYMVCVELLGLRARARIGCAALPYVPSRQRDKLLRGAEKDIAKIDAEGHPYSRATAALYRACVASVTGSPDLTRELLERAERACRAADLAMLAGTARIRLGELTGGARGDELVAEGKAQIEALGVKAPEKVARIFAPGKWQ
jgi:serine/threonine protein kinase/tetratricopeptide (TPR) repeat protein